MQRNTGKQIQFKANWRARMKDEKSQVYLLTYINFSKIPHMMENLVYCSNISVFVQTPWVRQYIDLTLTYH